MSVFSWKSSLWMLKLGCVLMAQRLNFKCSLMKLFITTAHVHCRHCVWCVEIQWANIKKRAGAWSGNEKSQKISSDFNVEQPAAFFQAIKIILYFRKKRRSEDVRELTQFSRRCRRLGNRMNALRYHRKGKVNLRVDQKPKNSLYINTPKRIKKLKFLFLWLITLWEHQ